MVVVRCCTTYCNIDGKRRTYHGCTISFAWMSTAVGCYYLSIMPTGCRCSNLELDKNYPFLNQRLRSNMKHYCHWQSSNILLRLSAGDSGWGPKQELRHPDTNPETVFFEVADVLLYDGKIYALIASYFAIIDAPDVSYLYLGSDWLPPHDVGQSSTHVGESDGQLLVYPYDELFQSPPRTVVVLRLNDSSQRWEVASDLGNRVFIPGTYYSACLPAYSIIVHAEIKGDLINFTAKVAFTPSTCVAEASLPTIMVNTGQRQNHIG